MIPTTCLLSPKGDACWYIADPFSFSASTYRKNNIPEGTTPPGTWQNPAETGYYYLNSRYYDPEVGRFINADNSEILLEGQDDLLQYNLFAYCFNNPVNMFDPTGESPANIIGGVIGGASGSALGYLLADALGLKGWKKWALISAATVGGAVLGAFLGPYVAKLGGKVAAKLGIKTATKAAFKSIGKITAQKMSHINVPKHLWGEVL
ncbi:MAG: hypothetical protein DBX53_05115 [Clostridiales bacterium]|nr:MAG: hypothetical protein DBX53_05115 [Clostridiales bacterium]